jgi:hypothetical protein
MIQIRLKDDTPELFDKLEKAVSRFVRKGAGYIEGEIKASMAEPKSGKEYNRGKDGIHVASAPGESAGVDSSNYFDSILPQIETLEAKIGTPLEYPVYLEEGTTNIEPRPLWERTVKEVLPTLETLLAFEVKRL